MRFRTSFAVAIIASGVLFPLSEATAQPQPRPIAAFRFGADGGFTRLENENYLQINAAFYTRISEFFRATVQAPLRFNLDRGFAIRARDWDDWRDAARIPQCLRLDLGHFDAPSDRIDPSCDEYDYEQGIHRRLYASVRLQPFHGISLGDGSLVYNYRNSFDPSLPQLGAYANGDLYDWGRVEAFVDDVLGPRVLGGRAFVRPAYLFAPDRNWDETPDDGEVGVTFVTDLSAPQQVQTAFGRPLTNDRGALLYDRQTIGAVGVDANFLYIFGWGQARETPRFGIRAVASWNKFLGIDDADGLHAGLRLVLRHYSSGFALYAGGEFRWIGNRYLPEYFDTNYFFQSGQFALTESTQNLLGATAPLTTKLGWMQSRAPGRAYGFQAWINLRIPIPFGSDRASLPVALFAEDASGVGNASIGAFVGPLRLDQLMAGAGIVRRNFDDLSQLFAFDGTVISVFGRFYLGSSRDHSPLGQVLRSIGISANFQRRYFLTDNNALSVTNDFSLSAGYFGGVDL